MYLQVFILLLMVSSTQAMVTEIETETNEWGTVISFCTYEGTEYLPGSVWKTKDCITCSCSDSGLRCKGFGYAAGPFQAPAGCKFVKDGCEPRLVVEDDETKDCEAE